MSSEERSPIATQQASPGLSPASPDEGRTAKPVERFEEDRLRDELVEAEHFARYYWAASIVRGLDVLDAGSGSGYGCGVLARVGAAKRCCGVDVAEETIARADEVYGGDERLEFIVGDVTKLPFADASFDVVTCFETIEHIRAQEQAIAEFSRVLRPGGTLLLSSPNRGEYPPGNPYHVRELAADELLQMLSKAFAEVRLFRQHNWLAAAILDDQQFASARGETPLDIDLRKLQSRPLGRELYTLAVCSDGLGDGPRSQAMLTHGLEVRRWLDKVEKIEALEKELSQTRKALAASEQQLLALRDQRSIELARLEQKVYWLDRAQIDLDAWMRRRPVRILARALLFLLRIRRRLAR